MAAKIGALHVALGIDTAQFDSGLNRAQGGLGRFGKLAATAFAAVAAAGVAAAVALGHAVKQAADHADQLSKTAQKIGVTVEALSRLEFAAKLSDVSLEQLTGGMGRLSRAMLDAATGSTGPAATAFAALGIAVKDASGNLRAGDEVFTDIADRFSRMEDGATKTALAIAIFGRAGAEMIPLLNAGRDGLKQMADESDRLGQTISTKTAKAAEEFNDNLTRLDAAFGGIVNRIMAEAIPSLKSLTATFADPGFQNAIATTTNLLIGLADVLARTAQLAFEVANILPKAVGQGEDSAVHAMQEDFARMSRDEFNRKYGLGDQFAAPPGLPPVVPGGGGLSASPTFTADLGAMTTAATKATEAIDPLQARIAELSDVLTITHDPFTQMQMDLQDLKTIWEEGRISVEQYSQAVQRTQANAAASVLGMAGQISGALAGMFKDNKAFAVANAVINTAEGVTKALAQGGVFGFISAGAVAAAGAAQIASILSANPGSASTPSVPAPPQPAASDGGGQSVYIDVHGDTFNRSHVEGLASELADLLKDGGGSDLRIVLGGHA